MCRFVVLRWICNGTAPVTSLFSFNFQLSFGKYKVNPLIRNESSSCMLRVRVCMYCYLFISFPKLMDFSLVHVPFSPHSDTHTFPIGFMSVPFAFSHSVISLRWKAIVGFSLLRCVFFSLAFRLFIRSLIHSIYEWCAVGAGCFWIAFGVCLSIGLSNRRWERFYWQNPTKSVCFTHWIFRFDTVKTFRLMWTSGFTAIEVDYTFSKRIVTFHFHNPTVVMGTS